MATKKPSKIGIPVQPFSFVGVADEGQYEGARFVPAIAKTDVEATPQDGAMRRYVGDTALSVGRGAVQGVRMLTDIAGADNAVSGGLRSVEDFIGGLQSATAKRDQAEIARILAEAEGKGVLDQVVAGFKAFGTAPLQTMAQAAGTSIPTVAAALIPGAGPAAMAARFAAPLALGAAQGAGAVKSSIYDEVKQRALKEGRTPAEAEQLATQAQSYGGDNGGQIALGAGLGAWAGKSGLEGAAQRLIHGGGSQAASGMVSRVAMGALAEGIPEAAQGGQEKFASNSALNSAGFPTDPMSGVIANATMEGLAGHAMGGAMGIPSPGDAIRATKVPEGGPMTRAANAATEAQANAADAGLPAPPVMTAEQEAKALSGIEAQGAADQKAQRQFGGQPNNAGRAAQSQQPGQPTDVGSAEVIDSPFSDRVLTLREQLADENTRAQLRAQFGDEALSQATYYAGIADRADVQMPPATRERLLQVAERMVSDAVLKPIAAPTGLPNEGGDAPAELAGPAGATPQIGLDTGLTGTLRADARGNVAPETNADAIDTRNAAARTTDEPQGRRASAVYGEGNPRPPAPPAIEHDTEPTGRMVAGKDGVRAETGVDRIEAGKAQGEYRAAQQRDADIGLTPDVRAAQERRNAPRAQPGDVLNPKGEPFKTELAANRAQKKAGTGAVLQVAGGWVVRPGATTVEPSNAKDQATRVPPAAAPAPVQEGADSAGPGTPTAPAAGAAGPTGAAAPAVEGAGLKESPPTQKKPPFVSKEDGEHLFGIPQKRAKALERIAKGSAYFGAKDKANDFITGNGLKETHEAFEAKPGRFEVRAKGGQPAAPENAIDRRNRLKAERKEMDGRSAQPVLQGGSLLSSAKLESPASEKLTDGPGANAVDGGDISATLAGKVEGVSGTNGDNSGGANSAQSNASPLESELDVGPVPGANLKSDLLKRYPGLVNGLGSLDVKSKRAVMSLVAGAVQNLKVRQAVVRLVPIDVMNNLIGSEAAPKVLLNNPSVLSDALLSVDPSSNVAKEWVAAVVGGVPTSGAAKVPGPEIAVGAGVGAAPVADKSMHAGNYGAANTVFTASDAEKARALLRRKLGQLSSGLDPEIIQAGITLAGFHVESGARKFAAFARAMVDDLGDAVKPYLVGWYMATRADPRTAAFRADMEKASAVEDLDVDEVLATTKPTTASEGTQADDGAKAGTLRASLRKAIADGKMPKDNPALRKLVLAFDGAPPSQARMKVAQEDLEAAIVDASRDVVDKKEGDRSTFDILKRMYDSQPSLNIRTSDSIERQAYSTPAPLAYLGARLADITQVTTVYEPTAGNGMLTITAKPSNVTATELDAQRAESLRAQGIDVTQGDAMTVEVAAKSKDRVITNPPFGPIKNDKGESIKVKYDGYTLGQIDHLIAARALEAMKDDGKAVLIIGANKAPGRQSNNDLIFFNWLYGNYNVTSHFEVEGDLYARQGAGWPVRVITIQGRFRSTKTAPAPVTIQRAKTWSEVYERFQQGMGAGRPAVNTGARPGRGGAGQANDAGAVPGTASAETGRVDSGRPEGGPAGDADVAGERPGAVGDPAAVPGAAVGERSDAVGSNDQAPGPVGDAGVTGTKAAGKPAGDSGTAGVARADPDNKFQTKYIARSERKDEGVLIPVNMAGPTQDALNRLEDDVGDIDQFAVNELGYSSVAELHRAFMGLQVDSVASAISQIKAGKGIIIADQTGIGKGRQAAGIIRWAARNGKVPIFVTVKPSLFTDMYGDLHDIGTDDIRPLLMNVGESIKGLGDERLFANQPALHKRVLEGIASTGRLPDERNALFMTYSQINVDNAQRRAVMALAPNAVFVLDESHNAGGASATGDFIKGALDLANGVTYLSATYAKRPDNMPVYFKTDIGEAVADDNTLMAAMAAGGLPLQTVVSNNLVKAGQMFRRERSYDGVSIESRADTAHKAEHVALSDETTLALRAIVSADRTFHYAYVKSLQEELAKDGARVLDMAGNQAQQSVDHTQFSSVVHNFVRQMLLGLKAQEAADDAIRSIKRGEKPLIAVEGTMGSFLAEYAENNSLKVGDPLGSFDYRTVLSRALERSRYIVRQLPNGDKVKEYIPLNKLDALSLEAYTKAQAIIDKLKITIPVSPIDWMRDQVTKAGYTVAEVTGRNLSVDYSDPKNPKLAQLDQREQKDKVRTTRMFNDGSLDAIILNVAGSTGISLHASEKFKDQRQRHMIVAQAAQDINIFMQMLGRIHRTGQVVLPKYTLLSADLPAEIRPTALLSGKMKSLNANTSSNTESATSVQAADMLNKYGDQIVQQYLADNHELAQALDLEAADVDAGKGGEDDIARKATGRLALMPVKVQEQFYAEVEEQYQALIDYLNKTNQNDLEPRTFDFDAQETKSSVLFEGQNKASPFGEDAMYGEYTVKAQGKAMSPDEIKSATAEHLGGKTAEEHIKAVVEPLRTAFTKTLEGITDEAQKAKAGDVARVGAQFIYAHKIGDMFRVEINGEHYNAIVTNIRSTHKASGNPYSLSKIQVTIAVNGALRSVTLPATQFGKIEVSRINGGFGSTIDSAFKVGPPNERETAKIITGNLLGAYGEIEGARGSIITFSKADGSTEQGILLPKAFNFTKDVRQDYRLKTGADVFKFLTTSTNENIDRFGINSRDQVVRVLPAGRNGVTIQVPKSKAKGGKYFLDKALRDVAGDFVSSGNFMRATVYGEARSTKALDAILQKGALYVLPSMADEARSILGDVAPPAAPPAPAFSLSQGQQQEPASTRRQAIEALVQQIAARWANAPEVVVVDSLADPRVPAAVRKDDQKQQSQGAAGEPEGFFYAGKVYLIAPQLAGDADVVRVLFHESLGHYGLRGTFGPELGTILDRLAVLNAAKVRAKAKQYGLDYDKPSDRRAAAEEVLAEMAQRTPDIGWGKKAIAAIRTWLRLHVPGFRKMAMSDAELVRSYILPARAFVQRGGPTGGPGGGVAYSRASIADAVGKRSAQDLVNATGGVFDFNRLGVTKQDRLRTVMDGSRPFWLATLTRDQIADVYGAEIAPVKEYDALTRAMENERSKIAQDADDLYQEWAKLPAEVNDRLARLMLDATVFSVHPDRPFKKTGSNDVERQQVHERVAAEWAAMPDDGMAIYSKVKQFHMDTLTQLRDGLEARITRQVEDGKARAAALDKIRTTFDSYLGEGPYFPLSRFGDFLVVANREADGERVVASYETAGEQSAAARTLEADGFTVKLKTAKTYSREMDGAAGKFIGDVLMALDKLDMADANVGGAAGDLKNKLMDDVNQLFIKALPDLSYRKHFQHRKNVPGFSSDMMRGFASSAFHAASHIARVNHGDKMTFALQDAYAAIESAPAGDFNLHSQVLNELTKRHEAALNPNTSPITSMLNQIGFVMYLGLSPAAGLINMLQTVMVTMPHLGARYGFGRANASLARAMADITGGAKANAKNGWNAAESTKLTQDERDVMNALQDEGVIDLTQAHDLASATGLDSGNVARSKAAFAMARAMKIVGWTFHIPEVMNRQVTALSAYRLEMAKTGDASNATEAAREAIKRTHFDYSSSNRARFMQGNVARVALQFKQYSQNMTYLLARALHQALKGETREVRSIARRQLVATLGVTWAMAGTLGLPGIGVVAGVIGAMIGAMDDDDEPWDWKVKFRNLAADVAGKELGEVLSHGIPRALMPWDISNRVGLGDLWFRDSGREGQNPREAFATDAVSILGPTASTILGLYTAGDHMARGNWAKATESIVPKFLRDPIKAAREGTEGVTSQSGEPLMDVTAAEAVGQLLGFASARKSEMFEGKAAVMNAKTAIEEKRQALVGRMAKARIDNDNDTAGDIQGQILAFNERNPGFKISRATVAKAIMTRRRNRANTEDGILLPKSKDSLRDLGRFASAE